MQNSHLRAIVLSVRFDALQVRSTSGRVEQASRLAEVTCTRTAFPFVRMIRGLFRVSFCVLVCACVFVVCVSVYVSLYVSVPCFGHAIVCV